MAAYLSWGYVFPVWMPSTTQTNEIWSKNTGLRQNNNIEVSAHAVTSISFTNPKTFFTKKKWFGFAPYDGAYETRTRDLYTASVALQPIELMPHGRPTDHVRRVALFD